MFQNQNKMKFINDITHAQLLKMDRITCPDEPLRFRNMVLVFCESGELDFVGNVLIVIRQTAYQNIEALTGDCRAERLCRLALTEMRKKIVYIEYRVAFALTY